jgi:hypothetical protein
MPCMLGTSIRIHVIKRKPLHLVGKLRTFEPGETVSSEAVLLL